MKKIVFFNQKGGVGKTTSTVNIAGCLCKDFNKKVLVVDCDSQMNTTKYLLSENTEPITYSLTEYFKDNSITCSQLIKHVMIRKKSNLDATAINIDVIPVTSEISNIEIEDVLSMKKLIESQEKKYDFCFFDCPADLSATTISALCASDYVIVPAQADDDSLGGYELLIDAINTIRQSGYNVGIEVMGVLMNNVSAKDSFDKFVLDFCRENLEDTLFKNYIRRTTDIRQARHFGKPVCYYKPSSIASKDYEEVAKEILTRMKRKGRG